MVAERGDQHRCHSLYVFVHRHRGVYGMGDGLTWTAIKSFQWFRLQKPLGLNLEPITNSLRNHFINKAVSRSTGVNQCIESKLSSYVA